LGINGYNYVKFSQNVPNRYLLIDG